MANFGERAFGEVDAGDFFREDVFCDIDVGGEDFAFFVIAEGNLGFGGDVGGEVFLFENFPILGDGDFKSFAGIESFALFAGGFFGSRTPAVSQK